MPAKRSKKSPASARPKAAAQPSRFGALGRFSDDGREFVVTDPLLPIPTEKGLRHKVEVVMG